MSLRYPRILTTSEIASVELNSGEVVDCRQEGSRAYVVSVGPKTNPVYVVAKVDDVERLSESERESRSAQRPPPAAISTARLKINASERELGSYVHGGRAHDPVKLPPASDSGRSAPVCWSGRTIRGSPTSPRLVCRRCPRARKKSSPAAGRLLRVRAGEAQVRGSDHRGAAGRLVGR